MLNSTRTNPYGHELALAVALALESGTALYATHRDYCGMGLWIENGKFCYGDVWDGFPSASMQWEQRENFVEWLAIQSDLSLSGEEEKDPWLHNNQRITRQRLLSFVSK